MRPMRWLCVDATDAAQMNDLVYHAGHRNQNDDSMKFDLVIDKGTIDALAKDRERCKRLIRNVYDSLADDGAFVLFSY